MEDISDNEEEYIQVDDDDYGEEGYGPEANEEGEEEDLINYKGIYFNDDQGQKFQDPDTGAHFEFQDMCGRLGHLI